MGGGRYDTDTFNAYATSRGYDRATHADDVFNQRTLVAALNPRNVQRRESRDSADNPESTPVILALDVTGSMDRVLLSIAQTGLSRLMASIYERRPVSDPHVMAMAIGDAEAGDAAPLQVSQFEADIRITQQLEQVWLERGGGGNHYESYALAWYFAAHHTSIDSFEKRGRKGFIFTVGDERPTPYLRPQDVERVLGYRPLNDRNISGSTILRAAQEQWDVYHVIIAEGNEARAYPNEVRSEWTRLLGQRAIWLPDHRHLAEVVVSAMQLAAGHSYDEVSANWDPAAASSVSSALSRGLALSGGL